MASSASKSKATPKETSRMSHAGRTADPFQILEPLSIDSHTEANKQGMLRDIAALVRTDWLHFLFVARRAICRLIITSSLPLFFFFFSFFA